MNAAVAMASALEWNPMQLRILTLNLHKGFGLLNRRFILHELRAAVREVGADLVFMQEVLGEHAMHAARIPGWPGVPHYEFLADTLWSDFAYGRNAVYPLGHHGNALLSKYPITGHQNHDVSLGRTESRGILHCTVRIPAMDCRLHALCVHLGLRETHRRAQIARLCTLIDALPAAEPVLVAGDFNDWRLHGHDRLTRCAGVEEVFVTGHGAAARTFPSNLPVLRLDRIYVRNAAEHRPLPLPRHPWSTLSDHAPLAAEIAL